MAWHLSPVQAELYIETVKNNRGPDISKGAVIAVASEVPRSRGVSDDTDTHYLVCEIEEDADPRLAWVHQPDVGRSWVEGHGTPAAAEPADASTDTNLLPLRKVGIALVTSLLAWIALQAGVDLGPDEVNEAATGIVGLVTAYLVPDPRVKN